MRNMNKDKQKWAKWSSSRAEQRREQHERQAQRERERETSEQPMYV